MENRKREPVLRKPLAEIPNQLSKSPLFYGLPDEEVQAVFACFRTEKCEREAYFFRQGSPAGCLYVLTAGRMKLVQVITPESQALVRFIEPSEVFGFGVLLQPSLHFDSAYARTDCYAACIGQKDLEKLTTETARLARNLCNIAAGRMAEYVESLRELRITSAHRRLAEVLLRLARQGGHPESGGILIDGMITGKDLADMAGISVYTVSRILQEWNNVGIVVRHRGQILLCKPEQLSSN